MKQISLICCLLIGLASASSAQTGPSTNLPVEKAKGLQHELNLTDKQTDKVAAIYKDSNEQYQKIKNAEHGNSAKMMKSLRPLRTATAQRIKAVLTAEQASKFDNLLKHTKKNGTDWSS